MMGSVAAVPYTLVVCIDKKAGRCLYAPHWYAMAVGWFSGFGCVFDAVDAMDIG